ncbi:lipase/acyltransferase domain-containing protein, partial [Paraburkholderia heleia]|uniref:lipase/acyltransferase domain-containing protein n=1 Tax=Paraburkholderia heleia TaxID=634127 RepID=UPI002AB60875
MATSERVVPGTVADDGSRHYVSVTSAPDSSTAVCYMIPDRVIPVIFVPGIMGSNLCATNGKPVWVVNSPAGMLPWATKNAAYRKLTLDPSKTKVYGDGALPEGSQLTPAQMKDRGWGTVSKKSYGDWLVWLQNALDDCHPGTDHGKKGLRANLEEMIIAPGLEKLTKAEIGLSYRYRMPVHAVGYNWLKSNEDGSLFLAREIERIMGGYRKIGRCDKVIVVTHSMGGLVARHCSEFAGYHDKILGIVHGVMPATGSATAYKRVKSGTESDGTVKGNITSHVLGATAEEITAVFAQSPGALQLLPSPDYGNGWLKIEDGELPVPPLPASGDPYLDIYTKRHVWWGLIDDRIINPLDTKKKNVEQNYNNYSSLVNTVVRSFHTAIASRYHAHTYAFYGDDVKHKTWGDVVWKCRRTPSLWKDANSFLDSHRYSAMDKPSATDDRVGTIDIVAGQTNYGR